MGLEDIKCSCPLTTLSDNLYLYVFIYRAKFNELYLNSPCKCSGKIHLLFLMVLKYLLLEDRSNLNSFEEESRSTKDV